MRSTRLGTGSPGGAMCRLVLHGALLATAAAWAPVVPRPSTAIHASRCVQASAGTLMHPRAIRMMASEVSVPVAPKPARRGSLRRLLRLLRRSYLIWRCAAKQLIKVAIVKRRFKYSPRTDPKFIAARRKLAVDLRDTLIMLGPTFIKVGQLLSTRVDVLPAEVIEELARPHEQSVPRLTSPPSRVPRARPGARSAPAPEARLVALGGSALTGGARHARSPAR